ncbi:MATE family efflux transporter [Thermodesulfobacteriota bacterium]
MIERWSKPNGYKQVLNISLPLVATMGTITLMQFTDRIFLANYSIDAISAAVPAGIASFTFISFFMGVANYTNAFVAQYTGAMEHKRVGLVVWQSIYFALMSAVIMALLYFIAEPLFNLIGHSPSVRKLEIIYFKVLTLGAGFSIIGSAMSSFYTGRGLTRTIMLVHIIGAIVNIPLDYCLINGVGPFPELGIVGAGIATITASAVIVIVLCGLFFNSSNRLEFGTWKERSLNKGMSIRLIRYGFPSGAQFFLEIFGFTFFIQMLGRIGNLELATSNIVLSIISLAFMPMVGFHIGTSTLVGQAIGQGQPEKGVYATTSALHMAMIYVVFIAFIVVIMPEPLLNLFQSNNENFGHSNEIVALGKNLLRFVVIYCLFDALNLVYSGAIKGAGDTKFTMWVIAVLSICTMIIPVFIAVEFFNAGIYTVWVLASFYVCALGLIFMIRYRQGKWKKMSVMEG